MRVIQVTPRYFPSVGGVEEVVRKISETLVERGVQVVVFSVDRSSNVAAFGNIGGVTVKRFAPLFNDPLYLPEPKFVSSLRKENADIIHVHNIHTLPPLIAALCRRADQKLLLQPHYHRYGQSPLRHSLFGLYKRGFFGLIFSRTHAVVANSAYEEKILCEDFPKLRNVHLLPQGLDFNEARRVKHAPVEPKRILYIGALKRYKNVNRILEGFAYLAKNKDGNLRLVVVGDGPERNSLVNLAYELGISGFVEWKSRLSREQLLGEYAKASVFILLSPLESFSRVVYDALIVGVPVVVLNFGALRHLVSSGFAEGVNTLAREDIAAALRKAIENKYVRIPLGSGDFLDWNKYSNRIIETYQQLQETR
jgi:glycosyltransferase involved in cell wall biosynthesis